VHATWQQLVDFGCLIKKWHAARLGKNKILKSYVSKALPKTIMNQEIEFDLENDYKILNEIIILLDEMILNETATFLDDIVLNEIVVYLKEVVSKLALLFLLL